MTGIINYLRSFFVDNTTNIIEGYPDPNLPLNDYTEQLKPYFKLLNEHPHIFVDGDTKKGEMVYVRDPKIIQEIAKTKKCRIGISANNGYVITVMVAREFPPDPNKPGVPNYGTYLTQVGNRRLLGPVGVAALVVDHTNKIAINIIHRNAHGWVAEGPRGYLKKAESLKTDEEFKKHLKMCAAHEVLQETGMETDLDKTAIIGNYIGESGFCTDVVPIVYVPAVRQGETSRKGAEHGMTTLWMSIEEIDEAFIRGYYIHEGRICAFADGFLQSALRCYEVYKRTKKEADPRISYLKDRAKLIPSNFK